MFGGFALDLDPATLALGGISYLTAPYLLGTDSGGNSANGFNSDYASSGANAAGIQAWQNYQASQTAAQNAIQAQTDALAGYSNSEGYTAQSDTAPGFSSSVNGNVTTVAAPPSGYTAVDGTTASGQQGIIGYNPSSQGTGYQSLQGYTNEAPGGGGNLYAAPVAYNGGYIDFGTNYNAQTNPNDYFYYSTYDQALEGGNNGVGLKGTNGTISYGTLPENQIQATSTVGVEAGGLASDPTINGVDYTANSPVQNNPTTSGPVGPIGTQSYNAQGQPIATTAPSNSESVTFLYGDNGSIGSLSGTLTGANGPAPQSFGSIITNGNLTPQQNPQDSTDIGSFSVNEGPSANDTGSFAALNTATINQGDSQPGLGTFYGQPGASSAPADTSSNYFTYPTSNTPTASDNGVNGATGAIGGYNPLGYDTSYSSTFSNTDQALGYNANPNTVNGITGAVVNQSNPSLQSLSQSRQTNQTAGFA